MYYVHTRNKKLLYCTKYCILYCIDSESLFQSSLYHSFDCTYIRVLKVLSVTMFILFNPFPHIDAFWRLCSRRPFENIVTKEEIAQNEQFLLLPQCFPLLVISYPLNYRDIPFFLQNTFKVVCCRIIV